MAIKITEVEEEEQMDEILSQQEIDALLKASRTMKTMKYSPAKNRRYR